MEVIDIHTHVTLRRRFQGTSDGESLATASELVGIMDRCGIAKMVALPLTSPETFAMAQSNEEVFQACDQYPGRFIRFCNIDPRLSKNDPNYDFVPILSYYREQGCKGFGELTANLWWDDPRVQRLLAACEAVRYPVIFHLAGKEFGIYGLITEPDMGGLERALRKFPRLQLVGHSQGFWSHVAPINPRDYDKIDTYMSGTVEPGGRLPELLKRYDNLWGDLSAHSGYNGISRDPEWGCGFLEEFQDRLLFGLDICAPTNETPLVGFMQEALDGEKISPQAHGKIMSRNAHRLLDLGET